MSLFDYFDYLRVNGKCVTLLDDAEFEGIRCKLDKKMKDLAAKGVGIEKQQSHVIYVEDEEKMWGCGILASDISDKLHDTLLYLLGLNLALRGGQEHYNLRHGENKHHFGLLVVITYSFYTNEIC